MPVNMKAVIAETFLRMAGERSVDKISVKDLVEECHISRQTFYYHFQDLMEVIEWAVSQAARRTLEDGRQAGSAQEALRIFVTSATEHSGLLQRLLNSQRREQVERLMVETVRSCLEELSRDRPPMESISAGDRETALDFYAFGIVGLLLKNTGKRGLDVDLLASQMHRLLSGRMLRLRGQEDGEDP